MNISTIDTRVLINVINKELEITRLRIENGNDLLDKSYLVDLQSLRNKFENHFFDEVIEREEEEK
jgi:hypothetical protein